MLCWFLNFKRKFCKQQGVELTAKTAVQTSHTSAWSCWRALPMWWYGYRILKYRLWLWRFLFARFSSFHVMAFSFHVIHLGIICNPLRGSCGSLVACPVLIMQDVAEQEGAKPVNFKDQLTDMLGCFSSHQSTSVLVLVQIWGLQLWFHVRVNFRYCTERKYHLPPKIEN